MHDSTTGNVIIFNGEIYNHLDLRKQLKGEWQSQSDTETILRAYHEWGVDCLQHLKGMFAFAIFDADKKSLFIARDRLGIKPLYLKKEADELSLASEVRMLCPKLTAKAIPGKALAGYLRHGSFLEQYLPDAALRVLPAGHYLWVKEDLSTKQTKWWTPQRQKYQPPYTKAIRRLVDQSVRNHLLADVPVACFLSGGIDSSVIVASAAQFTKTPLNTFAIGFPQADFDETEIAEEVATQFNCNHRRIEISEAQALKWVMEAVELMDLPSMDAINTYIIARSVSDCDIKVALSGLGGDELFGGYPSFKDIAKLQTLRRYASFIKLLAPLLGSKVARLSDISQARTPLELAHWRRFFITQKQLQKLQLDDPGFPFPKAPQEADQFAEVSWAELTGYMSHILLRDSDQMSMACSLELRVPFLDHELVEYTLSLPASAKQYGDYPKQLLIDAYSDLLPTAVFQRNKRGFELPMKQWLLGPLKAFADAGIQELITSYPRWEHYIRQTQQAFQLNKIHWTRYWLLATLGQYLQRKLITIA